MGLSRSAVCVEHAVVDDWQLEDVGQINMEVRPIVAVGQPEDVRQSIEELRQCVSPLSTPRASVEGSPRIKTRALAMPSPTVNSPISGRPIGSVQGGGVLMSSAVNATGESSVMTTPSRAQVIDFGGIPEALQANVRTSGRLHAQGSADLTQLEKAMMIAQRRDDHQSKGYSNGCALDSIMGIPSFGGSARDYSFWMQPAPDGRSGLLFPGYWVAAY